jgi:hypothetical protein
VLKAFLERVLVLLEIEPNPRRIRRLACPRRVSVRVPPSEITAPDFSKLAATAICPLAVRGEAARESGKPNRGNGHTIRRAETPRHGRASQTSRGPSLSGPGSFGSSFINHQSSRLDDTPSLPTAARRQARSCGRISAVPQHMTRERNERSTNATHGPLGCGNGKLAILALRRQ